MWVLLTLTHPFSQVEGLVCPLLSPALRGGIGQMTAPGARSPIPRAGKQPHLHIIYMLLHYGCQPLILLAQFHRPFPFRSLCGAFFFPHSPPGGVSRPQEETSESACRSPRGRVVARPGVQCSLTCHGPYLSKCWGGLGGGQGGGVLALNPHPTAGVAGRPNIVDRRAGRGAEGRGAGRGWELGLTPRQEVLTRKPGAGGGEIQSAGEGSCVGVGPRRSSGGGHSRQPGPGAERAGAGERNRGPESQSLLCDSPAG